MLIRGIVPDQFRVKAMPGRCIRSAELSFEIPSKRVILAQNWKSSKRCVLECFIPNLCKKQVPDYLKVLRTYSGAKVIFGRKMTQNGIFSFFAHFWVIFAFFHPKWLTLISPSSCSPVLLWFVWHYLGVKNPEFSVFPGIKAFWPQQGSQNSKMVKVVGWLCLKISRIPASSEVTQMRHWVESERRFDVRKWKSSSKCTRSVVFTTLEAIGINWKWIELKKVLGVGQAGVSVLYI